MATPSHGSTRATGAGGHDSEAATRAAVHEATRQATEGPDRRRAEAEVNPAATKKEEEAAGEVMKVGAGMALKALRDAAAAAIMEGGWGGWTPH